MTVNKLTVKHFIAEPVEVRFTSPPVYSKKPHCPDLFIWRETAYRVTACLTEWQDYSRRGRMARNMQPQHAQVASQRGSWGVGRFYFNVKSENGRYFRLYYDRAPGDVADREGSWVLLAELSIDMG
jgi:hypothetical protein